MFRMNRNAFTHGNRGCNHRRSVCPICVILRSIPQFPKTLLLDAIYIAKSSIVMNAV